MMKSNTSRQPGYEIEYIVHIVHGTQGDNRIQSAFSWFLVFMLFSSEFCVVLYNLSIISISKP